MIKYLIIIFLFFSTLVGAQAAEVVSQNHIQFRTSFLSTLENGKKPFLVVDKSTSTLYVYSKNGTVAGAVPASLGLEPRDVSLGTLRGVPNLQATPVGVFKTVSANKKGYGLFLLFPETGINHAWVAIHYFGKEGFRHIYICTAGG